MRQKNIKRFVCLGIFILLCQLLYAQEIGYFRGKVLNEESGDPLFGAHIKAQKNLNLGTTTDRHGNFNLEIPPGIYKFIFSFTGMQPDTFPVKINSGQIIKITHLLKMHTSKLSEVEIKVGRFDQELKELTMSMNVIQAEQIENKNITRIESLLDDTPGLNILDGEPQIRGGSGFTFGVGSKVGVFIDDMPILSGDASRPYWKLIPVENIKQIEVIKGASSVLSGSSSLSGAIYIRTSYPTLKPLTKIRVYGGFYDTPKYSYMKWWDQAPLIGGINLLHSRKIKNTSVVIGANIKYDHGYEGPPVTLPFVNDSITDFSESQMTERYIGLNFKIHRINKKHQDLNYGINGNFMHENTKMMISWLDDSAGFYRAYPGAVLLQDHFIFYIDPFVNYYRKTVRHSFKARYMYNDNQMTSDQSVRNTIIYTDYNFRKDFPKLKSFQFIGGFSSQYTLSHAKMYSASGTENNKLFNISGYSEFKNQLLRVINLSMGARVDYNELNEKAGDKKTIFRAGASVKLLKQTYLRMSIGQGYRYPTIAEHFIKINLGTIGVFDNPDLLPETSVNTEFGIRQNLKLLKHFESIDIAVFQQDYNNTIEYLFGFWDSTFSFAIGGFKFLNTGKSRITGADISLNGKTRFSKNLIISSVLAYNYILPKSLESDYVFAKDYNPTGNNEFTYRNTSVNPEKNILKYRSLHTIKGDIEISYKNFSPAITIKYFSKIENLDKAIADFELATEAAGGSLQPIMYMDYFNNHNNGNLVIDLRLSYSIKDKHRISVSATNLTNRQYSLRPLKAESMRMIIFQYSLKL
ncbi:TonB-dependent receptor domain-containing protein [candidate division KSB1 bacterium]